MTWECEFSVSSDSGGALSALLFRETAGTPNSALRVSNVSNLQASRLLKTAGCSSPPTHVCFKRKFKAVNKVAMHTEALGHPVYPSPAQQRGSFLLPTHAALVPSGSLNVVLASAEQRSSARSSLSTCYMRISILTFT